MKSKFQTVMIMGLAFLFLAGCASTQVSKTRAGPTGIEPEEKIAVVGEKDFINCLARGIRSADFNLQTVREKDIRKHLAPELGEEPIYWTYDRKIQEQMAKMGIRYLVSVEGRSTTQDAEGDIECGAAGGAGGCLGFWTWEKTSELSATIWSLKKGIDYVGNLRASASGKHWFSIFIIFPVGLPTATEGPACSALGEEVGEFIIGHDLEEEGIEQIIPASTETDFGEPP